MRELTRYPEILKPDTAISADCNFDCSVCSPTFFGFQIHKNTGRLFKFPPALGSQKQAPFAFAGLNPRIGELLLHSPKIERQMVSPTYAWRAESATTTHTHKSCAKQLVARKSKADLKIWRFAPSSLCARPRREERRLFVLP